MAYLQDEGYKLLEVDLSDNTQVNSGGGTNTQTLTPAAGLVYTVVGLQIEIPVTGAGAAGLHYLQGYYGNSTDSTKRIFDVNGVGNTTLITRATNFVASTEAPSSGAEQQNILFGGFIRASNSYPLKFVYTNSSDTHQTGTRVIKVLVKVQRERL